MAKKKPYRIFLYFGLVLIQRIAAILPREVNYAIATALGTSAYKLLRKERAKTMRHLREAFGPDQSEEAINRIGRGAFVNLSKTAIDVLAFPRFGRKRFERLVHLEGSTEKLDRVLARKKGVIMLTGHLGSWELLAAYFRFLGYPGCLVGRRIYYDRFDRLLVSLRESVSVSTVYRDESPRKILSRLRQNHVVGMSADQDIDSLEGTFVPFFGKPAWTPIGPAKIALASGAPIMPSFMIHEGKSYRLWMEDPIWPIENVSKAEAIQKMTVMWSEVVERYVRRYPDQWVWMHNRWKTRTNDSVRPQEMLPLQEVAG
ncbi:MAG: lysophospholipid acyltransferase family protein [Candidatus Omnitrophica bacterium]|nr:lysophospholipid acyltransferase family protein [Candidatus Omnitrophota bacterium]